jgi:hypothetical protein
MGWMKTKVVGGRDYDYDCIKSESLVEAAEVWLNPSDFYNFRL